jgi:hypothetical protein
MVKPQMWNRYAYALNNPLRFIDPTGEVVALANLSSEDRSQLLLDLNAFTGNEYGVNKNGELTVINYGQNASATADGVPRFGDRGNSNVWRDLKQWERRHLR